MDLALCLTITSPASHPSTLILANCSSHRSLLFYFPCPHATSPLVDNLKSIEKGPTFTSDFVAPSHTSLWVNKPQLPNQSMPCPGCSDWLRNGHVTQAGPIRIDPGIWAVRKDSLMLSWRGCLCPTSGKPASQSSQQRPMSSGIVRHAGSSSS